MFDYTWYTIPATKASLFILYAPYVITSSAVVSYHVQSKILYWQDSTERINNQFARDRDEQDARRYMFIFTAAPNKKHTGKLVQALDFLFISLFDG